MTGPDRGSTPRLDAARRLLADLGWRGATLETLEWVLVRDFLERVAAGQA